MRAVIDTNVLVSGLMRSHSAPARMVEFLYLGRLQWLYDDRILGEYRDVLSRPKFSGAIFPDEIDNLLAFLDRAGDYVLPETNSTLDFPVIDPGDLPFIEVALAGMADCIVTGNTRHFQAAREHVRILTPAECLEILCPGGLK